MAYIPAQPNGFSTSEIPVHISQKFFKETLLETNMSPFMGADEQSIVQLRRKPNGSGPTETFNLIRELDYKNVIKGFDQISGKGQNLKFYSDTLTVEFQAQEPAKLQGVQIVDMQTPLPIFEQLRPQLSTASKRNLTYSILKAATFDNYPNLAAGPVAERVVYGSGNAYNASITAAVQAMNGILPTQSGASVKGIKKMRNIAVTGGLQFQAEKRISPYMLHTKNNTPSPFYCYFMDTESFASLEADPLWNAQYQRGVIEMANQPSLFNGSYFKGQIGNIMIYEMPELGDFRVASPNGNVAAWNLFCGAQAVGCVWHKDPWFGEEWTNMRTIVEMAVMEMRGIKALKFPSYKVNNQDVVIENGMIHNLVQIG